MESLFVVSTESFSGKTALIAGLMKHLRADGLDPGYMKPVSGSPRAVGSELVDLDAQFMKRTFDLRPALGDLVPVQLTDSFVEREVESLLSRGAEEGDSLDKIRATHDELSDESEFLLVEGAGDLAEGGLLGLSGARVAEILDLPTLVVTRYQGRLTGDGIVEAKDLLGELLIGAVINAVPERQVALFNERAVPTLEAQGIPVWGVIPRRRLLGGATVGELAAQIDGEFLVGEDQADLLVETLCIGAMSIDDVLAHFRRKRNKAVIVEGARTNIQLAALETSTRVLILTGNLNPRPTVLTRAAGRGIPVVLSERSTIETVDVINEYFGRTRFHQKEKLDSFREALERALDFERLYETLGW